MSAAQSTGPLENVRVLDLGHWAAGPIAAMALGDLGAEVIKVEPPAGDPVRGMGVSFPGGWSTFFLAVSRNKKFASVDFRQARGKELLLELIGSADVLVENSRPGTWARHGLDYETLKERFPKLVYVSITGFGTSGPMRDWLSMDPIAQAAGGLVGITGSAIGGQAKVGAAIVDATSGRLAALGAVSALFERERTGIGQHVETDLFSTAVSMMQMRETEYQFSGQNPKLMGTAHGQITPAGTFETSDGRTVMLCVYGDAHFQLLAELSDAPHLLSDPRFATNVSRTQNREATVKAVADIIRAKPESHWTDRFAGKIPYSPVMEFDQLWSHEQLDANRLLATFEMPEIGEIRAVGSPFRLSRHTLQVRETPGALGRDTGSVLASLGYEADEIAELARAGVITAPDVSQA